MKILLLVGFGLWSLFLFGQNDYDKQIRRLKTVEQATAFVEQNPRLKGEIVEINSGNDSSETAKKIFAGKSSDLLNIEGFTYKVIHVKKNLLLRASYLYLNGDKLTAEEIRSLRQTIIAKYKSGVAFPDLAKEYTMDGNPNCDLSWITEGLMVKEFWGAVKDHKKGDIFTIDFTPKNWYYVALKTFDDRKIKTYSILKVKTI